MLLWTESYRPKNLKEAIGQEQAKRALLLFITQFKKQKKKALLLHGPSGCGKTALVYALASDLRFEVIELNASDFRNKQQINKILGSALKQKSLFSRGKLIFVDELEGISGAQDRGCIEELARLIEKAQWPIILATNSLSDKLKLLKKLALFVDVAPFNNFTLVALLKKICEKEKVNISENVLDAIAIKARGDARAAINDLQVLATKRAITKADVAHLQAREKEETISQALHTIFKTKNARGAFDYVNEDIDEIFLWLDENLPSEYKGKELVKAYDVLSKADVLRGRIQKQQHWRLLSYIMVLLSEGIAEAKTKTRQNFNLADYKKPSRILKGWMANQKLGQKKEIAEQLAKIAHCSKQQAMKDLSYLQIALDFKS